MNITGIDGSLAHAWKELSLAWEETTASWQDSKAREFEKEFLEELPQHVTRATASIAEISALLRKVRSDCE